MYLEKNQVRVESGSGPSKTLPENTCITSEVIHRHKGLEYVSTSTPNFPWPQNFLAFLSINQLSINQSILSLRLASTTAALIPYPFRSGIAAQIPVLPGQYPITPFQP
mgnify:CR=1 FL=1